MFLKGNEAVNTANPVTCLVCKHEGLSSSSGASAEEAERRPQDLISQAEEPNL